MTGNRVSFGFERFLTRRDKYFDREIDRGRSKRVADAIASARRECDREHTPRRPFWDAVNECWPTGTTRTAGEKNNFRREAAEAIFDEFEKMKAHEGRMTTTTTTGADDKDHDEDKPVEGGQRPRLG